MSGFAALFPIRFLGRLGGIRPGLAFLSRQSGSESGGCERAGQSRYGEEAKEAAQGWQELEG